jgi:hypothetical protein
VRPAKKNAGLVQTGRPTRAQVKAAIVSEWERLSRIAGCESLFDKALFASREVETAHRRMGRNFTRGAAKYAVSIELAAQYQVCKWVATAIVVPKDWSTFEGFRADIVLCQALCESLVKRGHKLYLADQSSDFLAIDYAGDIAL